MSACKNGNKYQLYLDGQPPVCIMLITDDQVIITVLCYIQSVVVTCLCDVYLVAVHWLVSKCIKFCCLIWLSINSILILLLDVGCTWSRCAFDRKPKIPIDVIKIKTITANVRYSFIVFGTSFGTMVSYFVDPLGPGKVVIFIGGLFKNRLWHFLKKLSKMRSNMTPFGYFLGTKMMIFRIPKPIQKK